MPKDPHNLEGGPPIELDWGPQGPPRHDGRQDRRTDPHHRAPSRPPSTALVPKTPNAPADMPFALRSSTAKLFDGDFVRISQRVEMAQVLVGWDQPNIYSVRGEDGALLFTALEDGGGVLGSLNRNFNPFYRNVTDAMTPGGALFMRLTFPFTFFFKRCEVMAWNGRPLGTVQMRFHLLKLRADILDASGRLLAEIHGPMFKVFSFSDWVYEIRQGPLTIARIEKHWGGWLREVFSNADKLTVSFEPGACDAAMRTMLVAAALTIDLTSFEKPRSQSGGGKLLDAAELFLD